MAPFILDFGARWGSVVNFMLWSLNPQEKTLVLTRRLGRPQSWSMHFAEDKNLLPLPAFEPQITQPIV
jgi:hypothetical protein